MTDEASTCGEILWCPTCDVPLLTIAGHETTCGLCGARRPRLIRAASDLRPVFQPEREYLQAQLGVSIPSSIFYNRRRLVYRGQGYLRFTIRERRLEVSRRWLDVAVGETCSNNGEYKEYLRKAVEANRENMDHLEEEAVQFARSAADQFPNREQFVSFSGGKDSAVVANIVREAFGQATLFFADTTLEHPETVEYVSVFAKSTGMRLETRTSRNDFLDMCRQLDPPSRVMRWCCSVFKAYPINLFWGSLESRVLGFDGIRRAESRGRNGYPRIYQSTKFVRQVTARPILHWNSLAVWLYLVHKNLPLNPLYERGYARVGCLMCPYNTEYDDLLNEHYQVPGWQRWIEFLTTYAQVQYGDRPVPWIEEWVHDGCWKQRKPRRSAEFAVTQESEDKRILQYTFAGATPAALAEFLKPICSIKATTDGGHFRSCIESSTRMSGSIGGGSLVVKCPETGANEEIRRLVEKQIEKAVNCVQCGGCIGLCPHKAISLTDRGIVIDNERCQHEKCRACITANVGGSGYSCVAMGYKAHRRRVDSHASEIAHSTVQV